MTEPDLRSQIASIQTSLENIKAQMDEAQRYREAASAHQNEVLQRITTLETRAETVTGLPDKVAKNRAEHDVSEALRVQEARMNRSIREITRGTVQIIGVVVAIVTVAANILIHVYLN